MECQKIIENTISQLRIDFKCIPLEKRMCIITPYLYPDNDLVEVFIEEIGPNTIRVTDLGETLRHLESLGMDVYSSSKRRFLLDQISKRLHINVREGKLEKEGTSQDVGTLLLDVVTASQSISDLIYTSKAYEPAIFPKEVSMFLKENQVEHEYRATAYGLSGKKYTVSVSINGRRDKGILLEAMSPSQESTMTPLVNRVIRMWVDINESKKMVKLSLLNDVDYTWRVEDIALLEKLSVIQKWSDKEELLRLIRAGY